MEKGFIMAQILTRTMPGTGDEISILGFGCMRFKRNLASTDMEKAEQQVRLAIEAGVNYFDTAYAYPGSEKAIGSILAKTDGEGKKLRDRVFIATKLPLMMVKSRENMDRCLDTSLERLGMTYIDYYLVHSLNSFTDWERGKQLGVIDFLEKAKADGKIGHIGFSWHGNQKNFRDIIDDYGWEFCQIQYNYLDEHFQAGTEGMKYAAAKGVGVIVMEPLRGGMIVGKMPAEAKKIIDSYKDASGKKRSPAEWALRWVWDHPEVTCALSGMNDIAQVEENALTAQDALPGALTDADHEMIGRVKGIFQNTVNIGCTGCAYCMPCPHGVDIPFCFSAYNSHAMFGGISPKFSYNFTLRPTKTKPSGRASACKKCGVCETKCPQHLPIMKGLEETARKMENPLTTAMIGVAGKFIGG
ncbi:MAG: aldo/keto reductase [Clostridiales bacterium]|nr:aldo/keto reductase [Clostridiales bacterium]